MKRVIIILLMIILNLNSINHVEASVRTLPDNCYTEDGKIKISSNAFWDSVVIVTELDSLNSRIPKLIFYGFDDKIVEGIISYPNYNDIKIGKFDLQWLFIPNDQNTYESRTGVFHLDVYPADSEESKGKIITEEDTEMPSLTATSLLLTESTAYDINIVDNIVGTSYLFTSSNESVVTVDKNNGKVKAKKAGKATISCNATLPDGTIQTMKSEVTVGYDENAPLLTEDSLDLEVNDMFDLNVENRIKGSKYVFTSSNRSIIRVNSSNGKLRAIGSGDAFVTCTITTPSNQVIVLKCDVSVTK